MTEDEVIPVGVDPTRPSPARLYDYYLGGTCNFEVDRLAGEQIRAIMPELAPIVAAYAAGLLAGDGSTALVTADLRDPQEVLTAPELRRLIDFSQPVYARASSDIHPRTAAEFTRFFAGLDMVAPQPGAEPGITYVGLWGAVDLRAADTDGSRASYCGVARKPGTEAG